MNSTHLFNYNFFIENIKKSKALLIFLFILLPLFTILTLSAVANGNEMVVTFEELGVFNIIFMYIIPVVLSIQLFNYTFKKKSADFIGSMPISRKSIFITNTIGGILLLVLLQAITTISSLIFLAISPAVLFSGMIWDVFLFFTISYIFVFVVSNLAISFSGNIFATFVSILLILFLVPFIITCSRINSNNYDGTMNYKLSQNQSEIEYYEELNYTAPSLLIASIVNGKGTYDYNSISVIKMLILTIIYFFIGLKLFKNKKYEMAEESYENDYLHLIIKFLTLTPFIGFMVSTKLYNEGIAVLFFVAIMATYYYLFDMITNKKIKLRITIPAFIISGLTMFAFFELVVPHINNLYKRSIKISEIESARITEIGNRDFSNSFDITVNNPLLIEKMLADRFNYYVYSSYSPYLSDVNCHMTLTAKNGKKYDIYKWVGNTLDEVMEKYGQNKYEFNEYNKEFLLNGHRLLGVDREEIKNSLSDDLDNITSKDFYNMMKQDTELYQLLSVDYKNHKLIKRYLNYGKFKKTSKKAIELANIFALDDINNCYYLNIDNNYEIINYARSINKDIERVQLYDQEIIEKYIDYSGDNESNNESKPIDSATKEDVSSFDMFLQSALQEGINNTSLLEKRAFIISHKDDSFDVSSPYVVLLCYGPHISFYTNDIKGVYNLAAKGYNTVRGEEILKIINN